MRFSNILFFITILTLFNACTSSKSSLSSGQKAFERGEYEVAIKEFQSQSDANSAPTLYSIAESYRLSNRPLKAQEFYEKALAAGSKEKELPFRLFYAKKINGEYAAAKLLLEEYIKKDSINPDNFVFAKKELANLAKIDSLKLVKSFYEVKPIEGVNSKGSDFSPIVYNGDLIFTSSRKEDIYKANNLPFLGLYKAKLMTSQQSGKVDLLSKNVFDEAVNEGTPTFSKDGKVMVFARGNAGKKKEATADVDLYSSSIDEAGQWSVPQLLSISDSLAWDSSPAFSADGRTLYFASNREGGLGGTDIYRVNMDASGRFGTPQNMGRAINTPGDEMFPFAAKDGRLFFASDGHAGYGGLDLFVATRKDGKIEVDNLGLPMNSRFDDFALTNFENKKGYFSSNRDGGQGDDDIYYYEDTSPDPVVEPPVIAKTDPPKETEKPKEKEELKIVRYFLAGNITDVAGVPLDSARIRLIDVNTNLQSAESITIEDGKYGKFALETETEYTLLVERPGYFTKRFPFTMVGKEIPQNQLVKPETDTTFLVTTVLEKPANNLVVNSIFEIKTIYYDLNKSNIRGDAAPELDKVVTALNDNPTVKIELGSHTDSRSSAQYNQALSQRRAEAAIKYIISKGIDPARLRAKGYGESQLVNKCLDGVECTEEEHQQNRRTEFKVFGLK
jgi:peptidoglycan-associated lipoprotein